MLIYKELFKRFNQKKNILLIGRKDISWGKGNVNLKLLYSPQSFIGKVHLLS